MLSVRESLPKGKNGKGEVIPTAAEYLKGLVFKESVGLKFFLSSLEAVITAAVAAVVAAVAAVVLMVVVVVVVAVVVVVVLKEGSGPL